MKLDKIIPAFAVVLTSMLLADAASATVYKTDYHAQKVWTGYNDETSVYQMKFEDNASKDGFWLVVSDGPNPKKNATEYAILYGDRAANRVTAYAYDGEDSANSYKATKYLGSYENVFSDAGIHQKYNIPLTMFTLDVGALNTAFDTPEWDGVQMGAQTGIWFHQSEGSDFTYAADGSLLNYTFSDQMWVDGAFKTTAQHTSPNCAENSGTSLCSGTSANTPTGSVPAPGGLALLLAGLIGMRMRSKS